MSSALKCPACHRPLSCAKAILGDRHVVYVYCGFGPCQPPELGDGIAGRTVEESYAGLAERYQEWIDGKNDL